MKCNENLAFYIRLSSEDCDLNSSGKTESNSITNQRNLLNDYYQNHPELHRYTIIEFCDDGFSGTNFQRPQFTAMMQLVRKKEIHAILVKDLSRFGRDYLEVGAYLELILPLFGTRFISVNDKFDSNNYIGSTGGIEMALRNLINGMYSKDLSVKIRSANRTRNRRGEYWGGAAFYGYLIDPKDKHKLCVNPEVSNIVVRIFDECIAGVTAAQIAKHLNDDGIVSPAKYKKENGNLYNGQIVDDDSIWTASTVIRILKDERYTGKMINNKRESIGINTRKMRALPEDEWIVVEGTHSPIISQEIFDKAAAARKSRIKTVNQNTRSGRSCNLFVCGYCGRKLQKTASLTQHLFCLKAGLYSDSPCKIIHEPLNELQDQVLKIVNLLSATLIDHIEKAEQTATSALSDATHNITVTKSSLQKLLSGKLDLYEDYRSGRITSEKFLSIQKKRQQESDRLNRLLKQYEDQAETLAAKFAEAQKLMDSSSDLVMLTDYQPEIICRLIKKVKVYGAGRIEIELTSNDTFITEALSDTTQLTNSEPRHISKTH